MTDVQRFRWWSEEHKDRRHEVAVDVLRFLHEQDEPRRTRLERAVRLYGPGIHLGRWEAGPAPALNLIRTLTRTAASRVTDKPPPRPFFATDGGDYEMQRRAEGMSKLAAGALYHCDFDNLARAAAPLAALAGKVPFKISEEDDRAVVELVDPWRVLVDERDGASGKPRSIMEYSWVDREVLQAKYPDQADEIAKARKAGIDDRWGEDGLSDQVCLIEAWHLPSGKDAGDGRYIRCIDTCTLVDEEWEDPTFPYAWLEWDKPVGTFWGPGIADEMFGIQYELNLAVQRRRELLWKLAAARVYLMNGTKITPGPLTNAMGATYHVQGQPPIFDITKASSQDINEYTEYWWIKGFQQMGISEQAAMAMKPAGLDSGRSQLIHADLTSGRLSLWDLNVQSCYTETSRQVIRATRRIAERVPGLHIRYLDPQGQSLERVAWEDVDLDEDCYILQCFPVSSLSNSVSGRMAQLDAWKRDGTIDMPTYRRLVNMPDLKGEMDLMNGPRDLYEKTLNAALYAKGLPVPPEPYDDLVTYRQLASFHLLRARVRGVSKERLNLVRDLIVQIDDLQERMASKAAPPTPEGPPGPLPPPPPPPPI